MTKEKLKRYRKLLSELELLKRQLEKIEPEFVRDSVNGSDSEFPYTNHKVHMEGYDLDSYKRKVARLNRRIVNKMNELVEEKDCLIEFIYNIEDSETRQIFIYRYLDGLTWKEIGEKMYFGTSTIRMKHDNFVKGLAPISTLEDV
ncbi:hypothetical protein NE398_05685 [Clostridium tertium]|jgi:DNA-directed RNA polymerase specialized sigma24 family protein|uniref:Uncharacterized protein n=1 Tax=Clostridium tertium TaxID=1559 RepID=A0A9X3XM54_9CLOT|nr:hypothetical protein [Clostridium tertium]MDC4239652.1 hypothetical protein [Clostridium tertium]